MRLENKYELFSGSFSSSKCCQASSIAYPVKMSQKGSVLYDGAPMDPKGLAKLWDADEEVRKQLREDGRLFVPSNPNAAWCEPNRVNAVKNTAVLLPALTMLRDTPDQKLPYLDVLQVEVATFLWKMGKNPTEKTVYRHSGELKKMLSFIKRRANHQEVTKDRVEVVSFPVSCMYFYIGGSARFT